MRSIKNRVPAGQPPLLAYAVGLAMCLAAIFVSRPAAAQDFTFHAEPAAAFWFEEPQKSRFTPGGYLALRPGISLSRYVALQASYAVLLTQAQDSADDDGSAQFFLAGVRVRPLAGTQPAEEQLGGLFVDGNGGYVRTGDLDRLGFDAGLGYGFQVASWLSLGPVLRYVQIVQPNDNGNQDSNDARFLTLGLDIGVGPAHEAEEHVAVDTTDNVAPTVIWTSPDSSVSGVAINRNINATFSEEMDISTINTSNFVVMQGETSVQGKLIFAAKNALSFNPEHALANGVIYRAKISAGVRDLAGNPMADEYRWKFMTIPAPSAPAAPLALVVLGDNHFEFDKSAITVQGTAVLDENIRILKDNPETRIRIAGYTSASGTEEYNQALSERRAEAVEAYLIAGGISPDRLATIGFGRTRPAQYEPLPDNLYSEEAKANMRVLFELIVE